jgi:hypothetical protein
MEGDESQNIAQKPRFFNVCGGKVGQIAAAKMYQNARNGTTKLDLLF